MLQYIKCNNDIYNWDLTLDYNKFINFTFIIKPNHNNTFSILYPFASNGPFIPMNPDIIIKKIQRPLDKLFLCNHIIPIKL
jgi:hypothetical protein